MTDNNNIVEDYDQDLEEMKTINNNEDLENEQSDDTNVTRVINPKRQAIIQFGDKCRVRLVENDCNIFVEKKNVGKVDVDCQDLDEFVPGGNYSNDGYFSSIERVVKYVLNKNIKEKILNKQDFKDLLELREIIKESNADIKLMAREIVDAIRSNECLVELSKDALDRSDRHSK